jgi:hemerythrin
MSLITWTKEQFGTNVSKHDQEHQKLFNHLNSLNAAVGGGDRKAIGEQLDGFVAYVQEHFSSEEDSMIKNGYPTATAHKAEHDQLVATCVDLQKKFHAGQAEVTPQTTTFAKDWLTMHIPNIDRQYGPFLNGKGLN